MKDLLLTQFQILKWQDRRTIFETKDYVLDYVLRADFLEPLLKKAETSYLFDEVKYWHEQ